MENYNYYYIGVSGGKFVFKGNAFVESEEIARKFRTKVQAVQYAKKHLSGTEYIIKGGGGIKEETDYDYYQTRK